MFIYEKLFDYKKSLVYEKNESNPFLLTGKKCFAVLFATFRTVMTALPLTVGANNPVICAIKTNRFQNLGNSESSLWGCAMFLHNASNQLIEEVQKWLVDSSCLHSEAPCIHA